MNNPWQAPTKVIFVIAAVLAFPAESFAQVQLKVIVSGGFQAAYQEALPEFERTAGLTITTTGGASQGNGPNTIVAQISRGVPADVVIMAKEGLDEIIANGKIMPGTNVDLAQTPVGVSVRAGAPKPDISTVDAFKQTLLRAKSIIIPPSTVGIYLTTKLFPQLGIAEEMKGKTTTTGSLAKGDAEIAVRAISELLHVPGTDFVGTIPPEVQFISVFSGAVVASSKDPEASKRLLAFLASEKATPAVKNSGMERLKPR
jgi:molybdate transport system substrate-binding protein